MHSYISNEIYTQMRKNSQVSNKGFQSDILKNINIHNLSLKSLCSSSFDNNLLHTTFSIRPIVPFALDMLIKLTSILDFIRQQLQHQTEASEINPIKQQLIADQAPINSNFHRNIRNSVIEAINFSCSIIDSSLEVPSSIEAFQEMVGALVLRFVEERIFGSSFRDGDYSPKLKLFYTQISELPGVVTSAVTQSNHNILSKHQNLILNPILENIGRLANEDTDLFIKISRKGSQQKEEMIQEAQPDRNDQISRSIEKAQLICQLITKLITQKSLNEKNGSFQSSQPESKINMQSLQGQYQPIIENIKEESVKIIQTVQMTDQLNQYSFLYLQKSLKYYEIGQVPIFYELIVKLQKIQREESGQPSQIELLLKNKLKKYFMDIFEVVSRNINRTQLHQLVEFCNNMKRFKYLGFEVLSQLDIYLHLNEIHYKLNSFLLKVRQQIQLMKGLQKDENMLKEYLLTENKLRFMLKWLQELFVESFYLEDLNSFKTLNKKYLVDKRVHQIVLLWNNFFEQKQDYQYRQVGFQVNNSDYFIKSNLFAKSQLQSYNPAEEQIIKKISFLQIANQFLMNDKQQTEETFSSAVITELVFPKLDLCTAVQQLFIQKTKLNKKSQEQLYIENDSKVGISVIQRFIKKLYTFYLNLLANTKDQTLRDKAINDLSKSISLLFTSDFAYFDDPIKQSTLMSQSREMRQELLSFIAHKIQKNYFLCNFEEQVGFLIEVLQSITQQCFRIEEEFFVSVEAVKGSVESMRSHSIVRQLLQKAQGQRNENLQIGAILEKKVIDYKKLYQVLPLLSKCCESISDSEYAAWNNIQLKAKLASLILELWIFIVLNNPFFMVPDLEPQKSKKDQSTQGLLTQAEARELNILLYPMKELLVQLGEDLNKLAFLTPTLLPGQFLSFLDSRIIQLLNDQRISYTCQNFYMRCLRQQVKALFRLKKKTFQSRLTVQELLYIVILNEVFQRSFEQVERDSERVLLGKSFIHKFVCYLKTPILTQNIHQDNPNEILHIIGDEDWDYDEQRSSKVINDIHKKLLYNITAKQQIKGYYFIQETISRTALRYTDFLTKQRGTATKEIISQDLVYFIQMSCSIERKLQEYAQDMMIDFIRLFPFACFSPEVIMTFSEAITFLYNKIGKEFDSKSDIMHSKHLNYKVLLHTDSKILTQNIIFLMNCVIKLIFRGLYIDHNFMKVLLLHLIKQETTLMSLLPFGYRFLKYVITSFRIDKDAIEAFKNEADRYNPYFWMTREVEFDSKLGQSDLSQFVSDKGLIRLQKLHLDQRIPQDVAKDILRTIERSVRNEIELEFQLEEKSNITVPAGSVLVRVSEIMRRLRQLCVSINLCDYVQVNKASVSQRMLGYLKDWEEIDVSRDLVNCVEQNIQRNQTEVQLQSDVHSIKKSLTTQMLSQVASLKSTLSIKTQNQQGSIQKSQIITYLFDTCKQFLQPELLKYILLRLLPFLHSISHNYFDQTFFFLLGELLNYTVYQINNLGNLKYDKKISAQDVFQIRQNYFNPLIDYELEEFNNQFRDVCRRYFDGVESPPLPSNLVNLAQISYYEQRWRSLCRMHFILLKFINDNMQIHLVKNVKLSVIANILKLNFLIDKRLVEYLPLENVCQVVKCSIEILQLMKELKEKFKQVNIQCVQVGTNKMLHPYVPSDEQQPSIDFNIENFYYKILKFGLSHFAKNQTIYKEPLVHQCHNLQKMKKRFALLSVVCKQLQMDKLHELNEERITRLKRAEKAFNAVVFKANRKEKLSLNIGDGEMVEYKSGSPDPEKKQELGQQFFKSQIDSVAQPSTQKMNVRPYYLRKSLLLLACNEIDKIRAWAFSQLNEELGSEFSLLSQARISEDYLIQIIQEIPDKNLNLAYYIIQTLFPILNSSQLETVQEAQYHFLGEKVSLNASQYLDCSHFFDIYVHHHKDEPSYNALKQLLYWRPPHIQILLKYISTDYESYPQVQLCFTKIMKRLHSEQIIFYLPQVLQSLGSQQGQVIKQFLIEFATQSVLFSHQLLWLVKVESKIDSDHRRPVSQQVSEDFNVLESDGYKRMVADMIRKGEVPNNQMLIAQICPLITRKLIRNMDAEQRGFFKKLNQFYEQITSISGLLRPELPKQEKRDLIAKELSKIEVSSETYMPSNPRFQVQSIKLDSGTPMQSAAKCPILVSFYCKKYEGPDKYFERKLKLKNQNMDRLTQEINKPNHIMNEYDDIEVEEEKEPLFIHQLTRHIYDNQLKKQMTIMQQEPKKTQPPVKVQINQIQRENTLKLKRQASAEDIVVEMKVHLKKIEQKTNEDRVGNSNPTLELKSCIFKVFDDIRQDNLALQVIHMFKGIFDRMGLDLYVFPYKAISNRTGNTLNVGGIIEVIPNTISRDQVGKTNRCSLYEYYVNKFGMPDTLNFQVARENFIKSQAAYSVISYILQIKDRHNGNILISEKGNLIHIDFGFIFDISPAHNMKFESANFKLTLEMIQIMGGSQNSEAFKYYVDLTIKAFLAVRNYYEHMFNIVRLMLNSGLKCFKKSSMKNFTDRFQLKKNDLAAAKYMKDIIMDAYNSTSTNLYDSIQHMQNGISK